MYRFWKFCVIIIYHLQCLTCICNTGALIKITVKASFDSRSPVRTFRNIDLQSLPNYYQLDVIDVNVSGELCYRTIVNFPHLAHLSLINANITDIHIDAIDVVPNLRTLSLALNKLTAVRRGQYSNILTLETIYLSANHIQYVEENAFNAMPHLQRVYLDRNMIRELNGNWFLNSPQIKLIELSYNEIAYVPEDAFKNMYMKDEKVVEYRLENNYITHVSENALSKMLPLSIHLERNFIGELSDNVLNNLEYVYEIYLYGNNLKCETIEKLDKISATSEWPTKFYYDQYTCRKYTDN